MDSKLIYLFTHNLNWFSENHNKFPGIKGVWYDGISDLIDSLFDEIHISNLYIEHSLSDVVFSKVSVENHHKIQLVSSDKKSEMTEFEARPILIFPSNNTHVNALSEFIKTYDNQKIFLNPYRNEGAKRLLENENLPFENLRVVKNIDQPFSGILVGNDWGRVERTLINKFRIKSKPSYCLQESVVDFGGPVHRMEFCDFPFIQGLSTIKHLDRELYFLTGNPRYDKYQPTPIINENLVLINVNFTYGIYENIREDWVKSVVNACESEEFDYMITQHPRDQGNLSRYKVIKSDATKIYDQLKSSTILITRFSSLIHESLAMGRIVIYFNPHNEVMFYDFEPDEEHLFIAHSADELKLILGVLKRRDWARQPMDPFYREYGNRHFGAFDGKSAERIYRCIKICNSTIFRPHHKRPYRWSDTIRFNLHMLKHRLISNG